MIAPVCLTWDAMYRGELLTAHEYKLNLELLLEVERGERPKALDRDDDASHVAWMAACESGLVRSHPRGSWHGPPTLTALGRLYVEQRRGLPTP